MAKKPTKKKNTHGGAREGAGRPEGSAVKEPTKVIRIPAALEQQVLKLVKEHKKKQTPTN